MFTIEKHIWGRCYPRNGNVGNPTPKVQWLVKDAEGTVVDRTRTRREAKSSAKEMRLAIERGERP